MRLGKQPADIVRGTQVQHIYQSEIVNERHRHRYEVNNYYLPRLEAAGLKVAARTKIEALCELIELPTEGPNAHPWFIGCQFHPEFSSNPRSGHPLFKAFVEAALECQVRKAGGVQGAKAATVAAV